MFRMKRSAALYAVAITISSSLSVGQMYTVPANTAIENLPGAPKNPPVFSRMTAISLGSLEYKDTATVKGNVASIEREESEQPAQNPNPSHRKTTMKFDDSGHLVVRIVEAASGTSTTTNTWESGKIKNQDVSYHSTGGKFADSDNWQRWSYDKNGHVSEFRAGRDKEEINDYVNFRYDNQGRPLGFELYAQTQIEISYAGSRITLSQFRKYQHYKFDEQVQVVDKKGRVIDLKLSDLSGGQLKLWYHLAFQYDDKGRVIEQRTDPFKLGSGDDYSPLPGRFSVAYDDEKQSGEQKYYDPDGKLVLHTKFEYDHDGALTKLHFIDPEGKEIAGGETFQDEQHKSTTRRGSVEWEVIYDERGNWTERRRWFTPIDGSPKIMTRLIRQNITYR
jgi:hypothetical protein